jgi:hypothetical protein
MLIRLAGSKNFDVNEAKGGGTTMSMGVNAQGMPVVPTESVGGGAEQAIQTPEWHQANEQRQQANAAALAAADAEGQKNIQLAQEQVPGQMAEGERRAREWSAHQARMASIQKDIDTGLEEYRRRAAAAQEQPGGFWDNKTDGQKAQVRLGIWLSAIGAGIGGKQSSAIKYLQDAIERDAKSKQARSERLFKQADAAKGAYKDALEARARELSDYEANVKAGWDTVMKDAEMLSKIAAPGVMQNQLEAKKAEIAGKAAEADMKAQQEIQRKVHSTWSRTTPSAGMGGRTVPATKDTMNFSNAMENEKKALELEELLKGGNAPTPEQVQEIRDRQNKVMARQEHEKESVGESVWGQVGRKLDMLPSSIFPEGMTPKQIRAYTLRWQLAEPEAIRATGGITWMSNPEAFRAVMGNRVHMPGESAELGDFKDQQLIEGAKRAAEDLRKVSKAGIMEQKVNAANASRVSAESSGTAAPPPSPRLTREQMIEKARATVKAGGPGAAHARAFLGRQGVEP